MKQALFFLLLSTTLLFAGKVSFIVIDENGNPVEGVDIQVISEIENMSVGYTNQDGKVETHFEESNECKVVASFGPLTTQPQALEFSTDQTIIPFQINLLALADPTLPMTVENPQNIETYTVYDTDGNPCELYDVLGQEILDIVKNLKEPGQYDIIWDGRDAYGTPISDGLFISTHKE